MPKGREFDLETRLIDFAVRIIKSSAHYRVPEQETISGARYCEVERHPPQITRRLKVPNHEAILCITKVALKELRETHVWLQMIVKANLIAPPSRLEPLVQEADELISIFVASLKTASTDREHPHGT